MEHAAQVMLPHTGVGSRRFDGSSGRELDIQRAQSMNRGAMSELTEKDRAKLPSKEFGLPEKARTAEAKKQTGNYPMPDREHAISAKSRARKQRKAGNLTKDEFARINRKADKVLADDNGD